jgi:DnaJ-class molecular chaperone
MTNPYRAMCAELVDAWDALPWEYDWLGNVTGIHCDRCDNSAVARARALLAQPVAQEEDCPGCEGTPVASNSPCAVCGRAAKLENQ